MNDRRIVKSPATLQDFALEFEYCWCCGAPQSESRIKGGPLACDYYRKPEIHHIAKPGRSDERANLLRVCKRCHDVIEGMVIKYENGNRCPEISLENVLWLKWKNDPKHYDKERIAVLRCRVSVPRAFATHRLYREEFSIRTGMKLQ